MARLAQGWMGPLAAVLMIGVVPCQAADDAQSAPPADDSSYYSSEPSQPQVPAGTPGSSQYPPAGAGYAPGGMPGAVGNVQPEGVGPAQGPVQVPGLVGYQPMDETMMANLRNPAAQNNTANPANVPTQTNLGAPAINWGPYTLGPDDVVFIAVRNQPEFTGTFAIGHDGKIQFGFLGDIEANGLTKEQLARRIEESLRQYVRVPSVNVTIIGFNSKAIYILGRVSNPGKYAMRGDSIPIRDAVIAAGLVVHHAKLRKVHIIKADAKDPTYRVVDLHKILYKGQMHQNVELVDGDIVVVPTTVWGGINDFLRELIAPARPAATAGRIATTGSL